MLSRKVQGERMLKDNLGKVFLGGGKGWANVFQPAALQAFAWSFNKVRLCKSSLMFSVSTIVPVKRGRKNTFKNIF